MATTTEKQSQTPAQDTGADRIAAAKARAQAYATGNREEMGTVVGLPEGFQGYWFVPTEIGEGRAAAARRDLEARGYDRFPEASVSGIGDAEVWAVHREVAAMLDATRKDRDQKNRAATYRGTDLAA